jgi:TonB-linked SusC/RagA family outer membrane protein
MNKKLQIPLWIWKTMKITFHQFVLLALCYGMAYAHEINGQNVLEKSVTLHAEGLRFKKVLSLIEDQADIRFVYSSSAIDTGQKVNLKVSNKKLDLVLRELLQPLSVDFSVTENRILLKSVAPVKSDENKQVSIQPQSEVEKTIRGKVTEETGGGLPGVSVVVKGTQQGTVSDAQGQYQISVVDENTTLIFSFVGYVSQEIVVGNKNSIDISLRADEKALEEVVVVGYGTQKRSNLTGSVTTTKGEAIVKSPAINLGQSLAGRLPGVVVNNRSGEPGSDGVSINIRGRSTTGNNDPLILIDGIAGRGSLERINPNDIESITVLKDASAAIYGARSANGVILVTTKRGKSGKPSISFSSNFGFQQPTRLPEMADAATFAEAFNEIDIYEGRQPKYTAEEIQKFRDGSDPLLYPNTNWAKETLRQFAPQSRYNMSLSGGNESVRYYIGGGYSDQKGIYKNGATRYKQYDIRSNIDANVTSNLKVAVDLATRLEDKRYPGYGGARDIFWRLNRTFPVMLARYPNGLPTGGLDTGNPVILTGGDTGYKTRKYSVFNGSLSANWDLSWLLNGLVADGFVAFDKTGQNNKDWITPWNYYTRDDATGEYTTRKSSLVQTAQLNQNYIPENSLTTNARLSYRTQLSEMHNLDVMVGYEQNKFRSENFWASRRNYLSTAIDQLFAGSSNKNDFDNSGSAAETARMSYFGRIAYDYAGKYLLQANFRYDGSHIFQREKRWGFFPGVSVGWVLSEESFIKDQADWLNSLKLRASYGQQGNDNITAFQYLLKYTFGRNYVFNGMDAQGVYQVGFPNQNVTWEVADTYNAGLDGTLWNGLLGFELEVFKTQRSNILTKRSASIPNYTGLLELPDENIGKVANSGVELQLRHDRRAGKVNYGVSGNFMYARNKVIFIDETPWPEGHDYLKAEGKPLGAGLAYKTLGIYRDQAEIDAYPHIPSVRPGDLKFEDIDGDGSITSLDRTRRNLTSFPEIVFGLNFNAAWNGFDASILFQGQARAEQSIYSRVDQTSNFYMERVRDRWSPSNPNGSQPRAGGTINFPESYNSDFFIQNASFVRLKNLEIGYTAPKAWFEKLNIQNLRLYVSGFNLFTLSHIKVIDPETTTSDGGYYPQLRVFNAGLNVTF